MGFIDKYRELDSKLTMEIVNSICPPNQLYSFPSVLDLYGSSCVINVNQRILKVLPFSPMDPVTVFLTKTPCDYRAIFGGGVRINEIRHI